MVQSKLSRVVVVCSLLSAIALAQTSVGRIVGTVADASGAVIPNASITVRNQRTGEERAIQSRADGQYVITNLHPAAYDLTVVAAGFANSEFKGVSLQVGQERTMNAVLQPAGVATEVTVSGGELRRWIPAARASGANVSEREVAQLPLNGRQVSQLYLMAPGAVNNGSGTFDNIRFSGRSNQENVIRFDGVEGTSIVDASPGNLNGETTSLFRLQQSLENVQEFRVDTSNYPAEYGTGTGGQISFVTKSGTNATARLGSSSTSATTRSMRATSSMAPTKSKLRLNQFGGSVGGALMQGQALLLRQL